MRKTIVALTLLSSAHLAWAGTTQKSFTPTGYKYPIMRIQIAAADGTHAQTLYTCPSMTAADCMVDLADPTALAAITAAATNVEIDEGEYSQIGLSTCPVGTSGEVTTTVEVEGTVDVGGTTYNTDDSQTSGMSTSGTPNFSTVPFGCGGANVKLLTPITVAAGSTQELTLLVDLTDLVWTDSNVPNPGPGGCRSDGSTGQDLCSAIPKVVPYWGNGTPTFERYYISHLLGAGTPVQDDANAIVNLGIDPGGEVFYVTLEPYYSPTSPSEADAEKGGPDYNTVVRQFSKNTDGSIAFQSGGDITDNRVGYTMFQRMTHTGTCKNEMVSSPTWNYKAFKQ